ncbi:MAG: hypothetical protein M1830_004420, partial [Pleopsidium flavum]
AYFDALSGDNPEAFYDLYKNNKEWRKDLGRAVCLCLEKLASTGVDDNGSLNTFWAAGPRQEWSAVLHPADHTWIGFLKDTPEKGTLVISSESCLEFEIGGGVGCRTIGNKGYTVLETCLEINPKGRRPKT